MSSRIFAAILAALLATPLACAQVRIIDRTKLPQDSAVQHAYDDLLQINAYARTFESGWRFPIPRDQVVSRAVVDLKVLESSAAEHADNPELMLFTGLSAHLAYNLDVDSAYDVAVQSLTPLVRQDVRAAWFLGIHECQSLHTVEGMNRLLEAEKAAAATLPADFWQDYANCAEVTAMPVHAVRAYDLADRLNQGLIADPALEQLARNRIKPSSNNVTYPSKQAWSAIINGDNVQFISTLCGESFPGKITIDLQLGEVSGGTCFFSITGQKYPSRTAPVSATFAITSKPAPADQSLEQFAKAYLAQNPDFASATPIAGVPCPAPTCSSFEVVTNNIYWKQGGAHALVIFFASDSPEYPGLRFESPTPLPEPDSKSGQPAFYRPDEVASAPSRQAVYRGDSRREPGYLREISR